MGTGRRSQADRISRDPAIMRDGSLQILNGQLLRDFYHEVLIRLLVRELDPAFNGNVRLSFEDLLIDAGIAGTLCPTTIV